MRLHGHPVAVGVSQVDLLRGGSPGGDDFREGTFLATEFAAGLVEVVEVMPATRQWGAVIETQAGP